MPQRDDRHDLHGGCRRRPQKTKIDIIDAADSRRGENLADLRQPAASEALTQPVRAANYPGSAALTPHLGECGRQAGQLVGHQYHPASVLALLSEQADPTGLEEDHRRPALRRGVRHCMRPFDRLRTVEALLAIQAAAKVEQRVPHRAQRLLLHAAARCGAACTVKDRLPHSTVQPMAAGPRMPGTRGRRSPSGLTRTEPLAECRSVTHSTEPDHSSRAWVLDSVRERSASASTGCSPDGRTASRFSETRLLSGLRPISKEVWITWRRPVSKTITTASEVAGTPATGPDAAKTAASNRESSASAEAGSGASARVSGSRPRVRFAVTVRRIQCEGVKRASIFRIHTGLPVRSSTVRRLRARRPR